MRHSDKEIKSQHVLTYHSVIEMYLKLLCDFGAVQKQASVKAVHRAEV